MRTEFVTDDWGFLSGWVVYRCNHCARSCSVIGKYMDGTPTTCPYGVYGENVEFEEVEEAIE